MTTLRICSIAGAVVLAALLLGTSPVLGHDYQPGADPGHPILLHGGDLYTISHGVLAHTDLLIDHGHIAAIGRNLDRPAETEVIDISGKMVYPGLIDPSTTIGLTEIGEVKATSDVAEIGLDNGEIQACTAYNWDSEIIPTVRINGITTALIVPGGRLIMGRSCLVNLDGWTVEDAAVKLDVGLHLKWPNARIIVAWWMEQSAEEQKKNQAEERARLKSVFDDARAYFLDLKAHPERPVDVRWDGFRKVFEGSMPLFVHADDYRQIEQAVAFAREYGLRIVLVGGREAYKAVNLLRENGIPVILGPTQRLPMREDDSYDLAYATPGLLARAGVTFCFSSGQASWSARNLPFQAGQAVAFGLSHDAALRALTLTTAEILGVDSLLGSLDPGKAATLIVSDGDVMDPLTCRVIREYINGRPVDLESKQTELYEKYRARPRPAR